MYTRYPSLRWHKFFYAPAEAPSLDQALAHPGGATSPGSYAGGGTPVSAGLNWTPPVPVPLTVLALAPALHVGPPEATGSPVPSPPLALVSIAIRRRCFVLPDQPITEIYISGRQPVQPVFAHRVRVDWAGP
jgi:hypothetical protein